MREPLDSIPKTNKHQKPRFWVDGEDSDYGKLYMTGDKLLTFLQDNDPVVCGCDFMTDEEFAKIPNCE